MERGQSFQCRWQQAVSLSSKHYWISTFNEYYFLGLKLGISSQFYNCYKKKKRNTTLEDDEFGSGLAQLLMMIEKDFIFVIFL